MLSSYSTSVHVPIFTWRNSCFEMAGPVIVVSSLLLLHMLPYLYLLLIIHNLFSIYEKCT